jgi:hypothetical protein
MTSIGWLGIENEENEKQKTLLPSLISVFKLSVSLFSSSIPPSIAKSKLSFYFFNEG